MVTANQYRVACERLDISIRKSAKVLGIHEDTAYRYARGNTPIPEPVAIALRAMVRLGTIDI
jgi:plasmid maintenance system antidote protein VapI